LTGSLNGRESQGLFSVKLLSASMKIRRSFGV